MTLSKLAEQVGVSISTVSKAFSGSREISEALRDRIFTAAKQLGCFDKYYKAPRTHPMIALLIPEPESIRYSREMGFLERAFSARGADTVVAFTRFDPQKEAQLFRELVYGMKVDGVVLWGRGKEIQNPDGHPLVILEGINSAPKSADTVFIDHEAGQKALTETLKAQGYKHVGFLGESRTCGTEARLKAEMRRVGLPIHDKFFFASEHRFEAAGEDGMRTLIARDAVPDVIVAAYNEIAYGAIMEARAQGYRVPEDVSFVCALDTPSAFCFDLPLSSLVIELEDVCEEIVSLLLSRIENKCYQPPKEIKIPVRFHAHASLLRKKDET